MAFHKKYLVAMLVITLPIFAIIVAIISTTASYTKVYKFIRENNSEPAIELTTYSNYRLSKILNGFNISHKQSYEREVIIPDYKFPLELQGKVDQYWESHKNEKDARGSWQLWHEEDKMVIQVSIEFKKGDKEVIHFWDYTNGVIAEDEIFENIPTVSAASE